MKVQKRKDFSLPYFDPASNKASNPKKSLGSDAPYSIKAYSAAKLKLKVAN
jgi:hypothetical protein